MADRLIISPTQVSTLEMCERKWGWGYIKKIKAPPNKFAQLGLDVHDVLEAFLRHGTAPDRETQVGAIAIPGLKYLPQPGAAVVEGKFLWELPTEDFDITGRIDWRDRASVVQDGVERRARIVELALAGEVVQIGDHKTTGDFKWAKTADDLREDVQAVVYAAYYMHLMQVQAVLGRWVYYRTRRTPKALCVDWDITAAEAAPVMARVYAAGRKMVEWHRQHPDVLDMPFDAKGCNAFGGCPYTELCNLTSRERLVSLMAQQSLKEKMEARKKAQAQAPAPAVNPPESQLAPDPAPAPQPQQQGLSLKEKMEAKQAVQPAAPQASAAPGTLKKNMAAHQAAQAGAPSPTQGAPPPAPTAAGGTLKEKMAARQAAQAGATTTAASSPRIQPSPPPQPGQAPAQVPAVDMQGFDFLFVDCAPVKSDGLKTIPLSNLLAEAPSGDLGAYLDSQPLPDGIGVTMSMKTLEGQGAYEALSARASHVVRGF